MTDVLQYEDVLKSLVRKYNNGKWDEDLMQEAWLVAVDCVNSCFNKNITDEKIIKAKIIVWVKNHIINLKLKAVLNTVKIEDFMENIQENRSYDYELIELRESLREPERKILDLLCEGYSRKEIQEKLKISKSEYYRKISKIKETLKQ